MARHFPDWLTAFIDYSDHLESPRFMRFWGGVSAIAGALRRRVWIDNFYYTWSPSFFIILVAPPGVATKSTTADVAMNLLAEVPEIHFGANSTTWQALATTFAAAGVFYEYPRGSGELHPMSAVTLVSRELGSLIDPKNRDSINFLIELWDGSKKYDKQTKTNGSDIIEAPWINIIGAATPAWIADNVPASMLGGGFISRCVFLYADRKEKFVAYPGLTVPKGIEITKQKLIHDLEHIAVNLLGEYKLTEDAVEWGKAWYEDLWRNAAKNYTDDQIMGYISRKQTHVHKLAIVLSASRSDELVIDLDIIRLAEHMLSDLESDMKKVFAKIGKSATSSEADRLLDFIRRGQVVPYSTAYRHVHAYFPNFKQFEDVLAGLIQGGYILLEHTPSGPLLKAIE